MLSCIYTFPVKNNKMWKENMNNHAFKIYFIKAK